MSDHDMSDHNNTPAVSPPTSPALRARTSTGRWERVDLMQYKQEGSAPFKDISRQVLFDDPALAAQVRYFEMQPGGYSTLERHEHLHAVIILRGRGRCLVGNEVLDVAQHDLVHIPVMTWHQFRANGTEPLGFVCVVNAARDRPQLPSKAQIAALRANPVAAAFIQV